MKLDSERQTSYHLCVESKKKKKRIQMNLFAEQKDTQTLKTNLWLPKGTRGGMAWGFGIAIHTLLYRG